MTVRKAMAFWAVVTAVAVFALMIFSIVAGLEAIEPRDLVWKVSVSGPCSCTVVVYFQSAELEDAEWYASGDTVFIFLEVKE